MMLRLKTVSAKLLAVDRLRNEAEEALNLPALRLNAMTGYCVVSIRPGGLLNHRSFGVAVSVNIIHNCHGDDDDVAGKAHPIRELAKEDQPEKG